VGRIGKVISWTVRALTGDVRHDVGGGSVHNSQLFSDSGTDAPPLPEDYVYAGETQSRNRSAVVGSVDGKNASEAAPGERRTYARDTAGAVVVTLHMKADGSARLFNGNGYIELKADGEIDMANGAGYMKLKADGEVEANGAKITTGGDVVTAAGVSLDGHKHVAGSELIGNQGSPVTGKTGAPE
jgi:hypothetical protein